MYETVNYTTGADCRGMAQIRAAGITINLWTYNKFLSSRPIKDAYAVIETPETSGLIPPDPSAAVGAVR
jgi:hypothetical protein